MHYVQVVLYVPTDSYVHVLCTMMHCHLSHTDYALSLVDGYLPNRVFSLAVHFSSQLSVLSDRTLTISSATLRAYVLVQDNMYIFLSRPMHNQAKHLTRLARKYRPLYK